MPTKEQKLRTVADAFMAALVECGFRGPWRWANHEWEGAFWRVWSAWEPPRRSPDLFPHIQPFPDRFSSEPRSLLWRLKRTSPFHDYQDAELTDQPFGLEPREFLEIWAKEATPDEWVDLADRFLAEMSREQRVDERDTP